jgi:hypothetical protein
MLDVTTAPLPSRGGEGWPRLTGFAWGLPLKEALLAREAARRAAVPAA